MMDLTAIIVLAFIGVFIVGGLILGHLATKVSYDDNEQSKKDKNK